MADLDVHTTTYGRPAVNLLGAQVKSAKGGDPLAPITVIVASNYAALSARRALAAQAGGVANVSFLTLHRLAERLGSASLAAAGRRPVSAPVLAQAVRVVLADDPGVFAPVADHPATELALVAATRELSGLTPAALEAVAACSSRAGDVVRIAQRVRTELAPSWHDEHDLLEAAIAAVVAGKRVGPVVAHLLQDLSPAGAELLLALASSGSVWANVGLTGDPDADRQVRDAHGRLGVTLEGIDVERPCATAIVSVSDPDEEVRAAVRLVMSWMRDGVALGRVALLYGTADPYARLLHEQLAAAGLVHNGAPVGDIGDMLLGRTLQRLLALPDRGFRRPDVLAVVTGAAVLDGDGRVPSRAWERISRAAGVVDGDDWDSRLRVFEDEQRLRAVEVGHEDRASLAAHLRRDAGRATQLAAFVQDLRADLDALASTESWAALVRGAHGLIQRYLGDERHRRQWPDEEQQAAERVEEALDRLAGLDTISGPAPNVEVFRRTLEAELEVALRRTGRFGEGVVVGHVSMAVGLELDRVVVLGMAEGALPVRRQEDSLLPDAERRAARGQLRLGAERLHDDHRYLLAAVAAAGEATLCFPRGDLRRQGDRSASRWLLADAARLAGRQSLFTHELASLEGEWFRHVPSYASGLGDSPFPATAQELRLATMLRHPDGVINGDPALALGMEMARARRSRRFTRFDGNLTGLTLPDYASSGVVSATRLQKWAACPHAFLMQYLLGVEVVEDPERSFEMGPLDKGSLVHAVLERFVAEAIETGRSTPWADQDTQRLLGIAGEVCLEYAQRGATGRAMFWRRDRARVLADLGRFAVEDSGHAIRTELAFDDVAYPLPDGRSVAFRGAIDRIDQAPDGSVSIVDYKTGGTGTYRGLSAEDPHQGGRHLQLVVYATAAAQLFEVTDVAAGYWFVTTKGGFDWIGYQVTPAVRAEVGTAVARIIDGIRAGVFPARPPVNPSYTWVDCGYCSPDGLSTAEARRGWERKRLDPSLQGYVRLCEPEVLDDNP
ncbi:MAG: PD-(D/E)XK nuclease family protein [Acidimicrobiales bacterium]